MTTALTILNGTRDRLKKPGTWCQKTCRVLDPETKETVKRDLAQCFHEAATDGEYAVGSDAYYAAMDALHAETHGMGMSCFNDHPATTQEHVFALVERAIERIKNAETLRN